MISFSGRRKVTIYIFCGIPDHKGTQVYWFTSEFNNEKSRKTNSVHCTGQTDGRQIFPTNKRHISIWYVSILLHVKIDLCTGKKAIIQLIDIYPWEYLHGMFFCSKFPLTPTIIVFYCFSLLLLIFLKIEAGFFIYIFVN